MLKKKTAAFPGVSYWCETWKSFSGKNINGELNRKKKKHVIASFNESLNNNKIIKLSFLRRKTLMVL
jgi:hypothetical protein